MTRYFALILIHDLIVEAGSKQSLIKSVYLTEERFSVLSLVKTEGGPGGKNVEGWLKWKNVDGNNLSNMSCIKYAKENNLNNVLIFEDDIYFRWWDKQRFQKIVDTLSTIRLETFFFGGYD